MRIIYSLSTMLLIFFSFGAVAQTNTIVTGTVLDESSNPVEGVTVTAINISDSSQRELTSTNKDGVFRFTKLTGNKTYNFRFSHVGFANHSINAFAIKQGENNSLLVRMQSAATAALEDVVVVGYGTQEKVNLTGAVNQVSG